MAILEYGSHLVRVEIEGAFVSAANTTSGDVEVLFEFSNGKHVRINLGPLASVTGVAYPSGTPEGGLVKVSRIVNCGKCLYCRIKKEEGVK